ncbi:hypothetical protein ES677_08965 [Bizionia gelidisalsuginis]|uniref:YxeA family protein n=1 Tax=Bizionia gelidisalsuginis TaxID=291188 RepID=A0ABY3MA04_9FLAO|nr:hypothetical protein [Bizionia gelidisalsuginis]TYC12097.1 hypothetical protein ES677_08965 [Bizionia gelidisalsuginis]
MKTKHILLFAVLGLSFFGLTSFATYKQSLVLNEVRVQDTNSVKGDFDGHEEYGYNFIVVNGDGDERTLTFQKVDEAVLNTFDLESQALVGKSFEVFYTVDYETVLDENGDEEGLETKTITALKAL